MRYTVAVAVTILLFASCRSKADEEITSETSEMTLVVPCGQGGFVMIHRPYRGILIRNHCTVEEGIEALSKELLDSKKKETAIPQEEFP